MLERLIIKNVALIEYAEINFAEGLNVLSGETGSGKSIILESVNFVLGAKPDKSLIRSGEIECFVSAEFSGLNDETASVLTEMDIDFEDQLVISRKWTDGGKNTIRINGVSATVNMLKKVAETIIDVHGQSEHFSLIDEANQRKLLDSFCGKDLEKLTEQAKTLYVRYTELQKTLKDAGGTESERFLRLDVLDFHIKEILSADVKQNEAEELSAIKEKLLSREKIVNALGVVISSISEEGGATDVLSGAIRAIGQITALGDDYSALSDRLRAAFSEITDISSTAEGFIEDLSDCEYDLDEVEERLNLIKKIFKKYGGDFKGVLSFLEEAQKEKEKLLNFAEYAEKIKEESADIKKRIFDLFVKMSQTRKTFAEKFSLKVSYELKKLGMENAVFNIAFAEDPDFSQYEINGYTGFDKTRFFFSANLGEPVKPLSEVISGGEISRFMLAVKACSANYGVSTYLFDEIDTGISGAVAKVVAEKLSVISRSVQVIAVSHLAQIVSFADGNFYIYKSESDGKTHTNVIRLDSSGKEKEIVRLLGGNVNSENAAKHAVDLINYADRFKKSL